MLPRRSFQVRILSGKSHMESIFMFLLSLKWLNLLVVRKIWNILFVLISNLLLHRIPLHLHSVKINVKLLVDKPELCVILDIV